MINQRTCIACRQTKDKKELFRIAKKNNNEVVICTSGKEEGRGAYICKDEKCINKAQKTKGLNRAFKCEIYPSIYEELKSKIQN